MDLEASKAKEHAEVLPNRTDSGLLQEDDEKNYEHAYPYQNDWGGVEIFFELHRPKIFRILELHRAILELQNGQKRVKILLRF